MARNLEAMAPDMIVLRHASSGACDLLTGVGTSRIINAGGRDARASHAGVARRAHDPGPQVRRSPD